ncbi:WD40 repeat-containing protein [Naegleria gruberi]|uniref:WD40 repeat-containing protein n=1 Tax=Naegleria gruberi TaxID=5762 RepID=D2VSB0_NAEGR|nr:WD40 repeat-containing protein [Naegleria gruberi]EFC40312.1 WD40 repeat-containing protein [Naegleria gruberi]|eukprot:XP_002673056.1 WD40 repeat-containing protein [Naegleria gruberi strain NEG-M]
MADNTQEGDLGFEVVDASSAAAIDDDPQQQQEPETIEEGSLMVEDSSLVESVGVSEELVSGEAIVVDSNNNNTQISSSSLLLNTESSKLDNSSLKLQKPSIQPRVIPGPPIYDPNKFPIMDGGHGGVLVTGMAASVSSSLSSGNVISSILGASKEFSSVLPFQFPFDSSSNEKFTLSNVYQDNAEKFKKFKYRSVWGANNLLAYCCQTHVMIFDPVSMQQVTSLFGHRHVTTCVEWCEMSKSRGIERGNTNIVASGDEGGCIIVWDYKKGRKLCSFAEDYGNTKKSIVQIKWLNGDNVYLLSLAANNVLSLWNVQSNTRIWDLEFPDTITGFSLDPFTLKSCCLPSESGWSYFINDINIKKKPIDIQRRLHGSIDKKTGATQTSLKDFICSPHTRDQFYVVTKKEVTTFDLAIKQTIHGKQLKGGRADFQTLYPIESEPSVFYSLHDDGTVCVWEYNGEKFEPNVCDVVRGSKHGADRPGLLYGLSISPIDHSKVAAVSADGKIWIWRVNLSHKIKTPPQEAKPVEEQVPSSKIKVNTKWMLEGLAEYTGSVISSIKVSPFDDKVAVGTISGLLLVYDLLTGNVVVKHDVFNNSPVLGIRWFGASSVLCFSSSVYEKKKDRKSNELRIVNLVSGKHTTINVNREDQHKKEESKAGGIKGIRISNSYKYLVIILQDRPIEVWRLDTLKLIRMIPFSNVTSLEWVPLSKHHPERELLYFTTTDGSLHFYKVENYKVEPDVKKPKVFVNTITALAWKNDRLVSGDVTGTITVWDLQHKKTKTIQTHRGLVKKISVSKEHNHILVLFNEGDFGIWDLDQYAKVANSPPHIKAVASDWSRGNYPVVATNSGSILVFDIQLSTCNTNVLFHTRLDHLKNPCSLKSDEAQYFRALIENNKLPFDDMVDENTIIDEPNTYRNCCGDVIDNKKVKELYEKALDHRYLLPQNMVVKLKNPSTNTAERCLIAAEYFGDKIAYQFWKLAIEFLGKFSKQNINPADIQKEAPPAEEDHFFTEQTELERFDSNVCYRSSLPSTFDLLRDNDSVRNEEMKILQQHDQTLQHKIKSGAPTEQIQDLFSLVARSESELLQKDQAVKTLLQTPLDSKNLYANFLHATVLAASNSPSHFKETVQFVASSLISLKKDNDIEFGVQLLCSIGEGLKACRILQDFDMWEKAARIAKSILPEHESIIVLTKWADYLQSNNQLLKSIGVWMSLGLFKEVLDLLHKSELDDIASLFTKAYDEYLPHLPLNELHRYFVLRVSSPSKLSEPLYSSSKSHDDFEMTCRKLKYFVYQQYAVFLDKIGCNELADNYKVLIDGKDIGLTLPPNNLSSQLPPEESNNSLDLNRQESWVVVDSDNNQPPPEASQISTDIPSEDIPTSAEE